MSKIVSETGVVRARLISPGLGTCGYYSPKLLEKSAAKFAGSQVFWDHPTTTEESTRPERSLRDLAGKIIGTPVWESAGKEGAGIYGDVQVFEPFREAVNELGPHIGMSIRASGVGKSGSVDGKNTTIIESIDAVQSVDFVTLAGRGGKVLQMFEAARTKAAQSQQEAEMTAEEIQKLVESAVTKAVTEVQKPVADLQQRALRGDAMVEAHKVLKPITLSEASKQRVIDVVMKEAIPVTAEGALDITKFTERVNAEAKSEGSYVASLTNSGRISGMGIAPVAETTPPKPEEINARSVTVFKRLGLSEAGAKAAVQGRVA